MDILEKTLNRIQLDLARRISVSSHNLNIKTYLVGGSARDVLLGHVPVDLDFTVVSDDPNILKVLSSDIGGVILSSSQFHTVKMDVAGMVIDVSMARKETYKDPGCLPTISLGVPIEEDLFRRDFSINAIALSINNHDWGKIIDPGGGNSDIGIRSLKILHEASFIDDPTRILRAVRYLVRLNCSLEYRTDILFQEGLKYLQLVSPHRTRREFDRNLAEINISQILRESHDRGVLSSVHPSLNLNKQLYSALNSLDYLLRPSNDAIYAALTFDSTESLRNDLGNRLNLNSKLKTVLNQVGEIKSLFHIFSDTAIKPVEIWSRLKNFDISAIRGCSLSLSNTVVKKALDLYIQDLRDIKPMLNGKDLIDMGINPGPDVGDTLNSLTEARLEGKILSLKDEKEYILSLDN